MRILVTGGLGFIGSHTVVELIKKGHYVEIVDNLSNSKIEITDRIEKITGILPVFHQADATDKSAMKEIFEEGNFDGVMHFAGFKSVSESIEEPVKYLYNNITTTLVLLEQCEKYNVNRFVFSSSATVYGDQPSPLNEEMELKERTNPYGETKVINEDILKEAGKYKSDFSVAILRYFNPIGAHESGLIGEDPNGIPGNLMPYITRVAKGILPELKIFGDDYDTVDGTGVRDYIHVVDLAKGHVMAIEGMKNGTSVYNLGTGKGTSVLELVEAFKRVNKIDVPYTITGRRGGDLAVSYADASKIEKELGWVAEKTIEDMVKDSWKFERLNS
ncbi:MAG: UDP-glucose 4-epimerase GalE [Gudongella sp.]|jgi:UDP-glucose 4-epimerase|nr:UDP-glucose 4-epimerase GalE [Gudongella sp.]